VTLYDKYYQRAQDAFARRDAQRLAALCDEALTDAINRALNRLLVNPADAVRLPPWTLPSERRDAAGEGQP
jgi:hypothetical protein